MTTVHDTADQTASFSDALRAATWQDHQEAEASAYMTALLAGELDRSAYAALVAQHWFVYEVLEGAATAMVGDPVAGPFLFPELVRLPTLEEDLEALLGEGWRDRIEPLPATAAYCDRMREVCFDSAGALVAHHYTRYLGDLSGGQHIGRVVARAYDLPGAGTSFYRFEAIPDARAFKDRYRALLDAAPWSPEVRDAVIAEIRLAYHLNTAVFRDLDATLP